MLHVAGEFTLKINTATANPMEVSWHLVFRAKDGTDYALYVDEQQNPTVFSFQVESETFLSIFPLRSRSFKKKTYGK